MPTGAVPGLASLGRLMIAYSARLRWDVHRGVAVCDGVSVELRERPAWVPWYEVDYVPGLVAFCRDRACDKVRDLEVAERVAIERDLAAFAGRVRGALVC